MNEPIYLDYNATTPVAPEVLEVMLPWMSERPWNASSAHWGGRVAANAVEAARRQLAELVGCRPSEIVWTSGATEANNLALLGAVESSERRKVLVSATEHKAVLDTAQSLKRRGFAVELIPVNRDGEVDVAAVSELLDASTCLVSVMLANNETGVIQPIREIADLVHGVGALMHTDATQAIGKIAVDLLELGVDMASMSAHKFYGPKGVGALYVRRGVGLSPQQHGGGHEGGRRSGTLNVPGIVGLGRAAELAGEFLIRDEQVRETELLGRLVDGLESSIPDVLVVGRAAKRLPNTVVMRFAGADAEAVMANAPDVMVSSGSACTSHVPEPSHVLQAMGMAQSEAYECLRFSIGRPTTRLQIDEAVVAIAGSVRRVRELTAAEAATSGARWELA